MLRKSHLVVVLVCAWDSGQCRGKTSERTAVYFRLCFCPLVSSLLAGVTITPREVPLEVSGSGQEKFDTEHS